MKKVKWILIILVILIVAGVATYFGLLNRPEKDYRFHYDPGDFFVTDIQDSRRLLKTDVIISMADHRRNDFYIEHNHRIRNTIIFVLRNMNEEELMRNDIEAVLNLEMTRRLNREFEVKEFIQVYFNEFVIQ